MLTSRFAKLTSKTLLSSDRWQYAALRFLVSRVLFGLGAIAKPINSSATNILNLYGCVLAFEPNRLAAQINLYGIKFDNHLVIASRAFFEIAFARGELPKICNFLQAQD